MLSALFPMLPIVWFRSFSTTCGGTFISASMVANVRRRSWRVHPSTPSSKFFLYLLQPEIGRSSDTYDGKRRSVLFRLGIVSKIAAVMSPYGNVCCLPFLVIQSGSVINRSFSLIHGHRRFDVSPFRWPFR